MSPAGIRSVLPLLPLIVGSTPIAAQGGNGHLDRAVEAFWLARDSQARNEAVQSIMATGASPGTVLEQLRTAPEYSARVARGRLNLERRGADGQKHHYVLVVPSQYHPEHPVPLRIYLHGGAGGEDRRQALRWDFDQFGPDSGLAVYPSAWREAPWWSERQADNILGLITELKRSYNIDENRIAIIGVADGGTGAFYLAFRHPTAFSSFLSLLGHGGALTNPRLGAGGPFFVTNLRNSPMLLVNGALDPLYPVRLVAPYVLLYRQAGTAIVFRPQAVSGLDLNWWPSERAVVDSFIRANPRQPYPARITWETTRTDRFNRAWWLVIDSLGPTATDFVFPSYDSVIPLAPEPSLGVRVEPGGGNGVRILAVELGSVGGAAGLRARDLIMAVNGVATPDVATLLNATRGLQWGDTMQVLVERSGARGVLPVVLGPRPDPAQNRPVLAFPRNRPTGRVDVRAEGNSIEVQSSGVRRYTLLLSPDQFDLARPIRVVTNGELSFEGLVQPSVSTLLKWAARDWDRQMLFLAELSIDVQ